MPLDPTGIFAGATGVGALCVLGVFLVLDGRAPELFPTLETYAKTATWGIVAAVPVLAVAYVVGLLAIAGTGAAVEALYGDVVGRGARDVLSMFAIPKDSLVATAYLELRQRQELLGGSAIGVLLLALGAFSERRNLPEVRGAVTVAGSLALVAALLCLAGSVASGREAHALAGAMRMMTVPSAR